MESKKQIYIVKRENGFIEYAKETFVVAETEVASTLASGEKEVEELKSQIKALTEQKDVLETKLSKSEETHKDFRELKRLIEQMEQANKTEEKETV